MDSTALINELVDKRLVDYTSDELDTYIVDAYVSLEMAIRGSLYTKSGYIVIPNMITWGQKEDGANKICQACLAGTFFISKVLEPIPVNSTPELFVEGYYRGLEMELLTFLDGLRYIHTDLKNRLQGLLEELGYVTDVLKEKVSDSYLEESDSYLEEEPSKVLHYLKQFIDMNPRLTQKLQAVTTT